MKATYFGNNVAVNVFRGVVFVKPNAYTDSISVYSNEFRAGGFKMQFADWLTLFKELKSS